MLDFLIFRGEGKSDCTRGVEVEPQFPMRSLFDHVRLRRSIVRVQRCRRAQGIRIRSLEVVANKEWTMMN